MWGAPSSSTLSLSMGWRLHSARTAERSCCSGSSERLRSGTDVTTCAASTDKSHTPCWPTKYDRWRAVSSPAATCCSASGPVLDAVVGSSPSEAGASAGSSSACCSSIWMSSTVMSARIAPSGTVRPNASRSSAAVRTASSESPPSSTNRTPGSIRSTGTESTCDQTALMPSAGTSGDESAARDRASASPNARIARCSASNAARASSRSTTVVFTSHCRMRSSRCSKA